MDARNFFFKYRSFTPIPMILVAIILAQTTWLSFTVGLVITLVGECVRIWAVRYAGSATRTTGEVGADELVTTGPFGHLRNPLYLGNFFLSLGILLMAWPWMPWFLLLFLALYVIQYGAIISLEEDFLRKKFTAVYTEYEQNVPRIIPRLTPWSKGDRKPTTLKKALRTERNTLQSLTISVLVIMLRWILF